ncbi:hypothetical protein RRG08_049274 [Elysia crispata]|uniref:Uncharacterized protein n=1 Tax=Elysia crispata TaxID=231223 RepID=A0AAE1DJ96_9GAST|nr:hypothetical protein RRG08_049274 [Elysia crispata]
MVKATCQSSSSDHPTHDPIYDPSENHCNQHESDSIFDQETSGNDTHTSSIYHTDNTRRGIASLYRSACPKQGLDQLRSAWSLIETKQFCRNKASPVR